MFSHKEIHSTYTSGVSLIVKDLNSICYPVYTPFIVGRKGKSRLLVDFAAEVKLTGSARVKIEKRFTLSCFFENKVHYYPINLVNTKTTIPLRVGA